MTGTIQQSERGRVIAPRSLIEWHYAAQAGAFFDEIENEERLIHAHSNITPIPMWNHSVVLADGLTSEAVEAAVNWHRARGRRPTIYMMDRGEPNLVEGFDRFDRESWMVLDWERATAAQPGEELRQAESSAELERFIEAFYAAYKVTDPGYAQMLRKKAGGAAEHNHFYLEVDGRVGSITTVVVHEGVAGIYNVGTPPEARRRGYAEMLLTQLMGWLRSAGIETVLLQVESGSPAEKLYEKLGFWVQFQRSGWRLANWQPVTAVQVEGPTGLGRLLKGAGTQSGAWHESRVIAPELERELQQLKARHGLPTESFLIGAAAALIHRYVGSSEVTVPISGEGGVTFQLNGETAGLELARKCGEGTNAEKLGKADFALRFGGGGHFASGAEIEFVIDPRAPRQLMVLGDNQARKEVVRRLATQYLVLLSDLAAHPEKPISRLELLTPAEKQLLTVEWNRTEFVPVHTTLQSLFEEQVERSPEAVALVFAKAGVSGIAQEMSYRLLNRAANRLAHRLLAAGAGPEVMVGICLERSLDFLVAMLAVFKAGAAFVPLDPAYPAERLGFMVQDSKAPVIITNSGLAELFNQAKVRLLCLDKEAESLARESEKNPGRAARPENAAYVIYTSGSTGQPKGVVVTQEAIANHARECKGHYGINPRDKVLQFSSFNFDASLEQILPALIAGATLVVRDEEVWSTAEFGRKLIELELTVADIPTAYWHQLVEEWHRAPEDIPNHRLRLIVVGGEALSPQKLELWKKLPGRKVRLVNAYGPTETTITATSWEVEGSGEGLSKEAVPIGRPRGNRRVYLLDQYGNPVPLGVPGELLIGGGMLARGYLNRAELTQQKFIADPFSDAAEARLYRTGDLVRYREDGQLEFLGRLDDQVKIRGFRIELGEVESVLRLHPHVREAMVLARELAGGEKRLVGYVTGKGSVPGGAELRSFLAARLPEYMVPAAIVGLVEWPLMPNGKIDRRALPEPDFATGGQEGTGPRDPLELQLQLAFERVLKKPGVGVKVSFFELGGDSLQALELLVEIEKVTGRQLPLGTLYQSATVEALATEVRERSPEEWSAVVPLQKSGKRTALNFIHTTPGDILGYGNLVYRLGTEHPSFGFQSLGLKDGALCHETIEEMANYYTELLVKNQPEGPYHLIGWCYGGVLAVEMARLLKEQGREVGLLGLLETIAMPPAGFNARYYAHRVHCLLRMAPTQWGVYVRAKLKYARDVKMANRLRFRQMDDSSRVAPDGTILDPRLAQLERVYNTNLEALNKYRTRYYPGKVTLFNAAERDKAVIADPIYGWAGLASEVEVHKVPGDHDTMLMEPNVNVLARKILECLEPWKKESQAQ